VSPKSRREAEVGLGVEERGVLKPPIKRDPSGAVAEFLDSAGQAANPTGVDVAHTGDGLRSVRRRVRPVDAGGRHPDERCIPPREVAHIALADFVLEAWA